MIKKTTLLLNKFIIFFGAFFAFESNSNAQTIVPQTLVGLEKLCAGSSFNEFNATFSYLDFPTGTTFVVELSNSLGDFRTPIATTLLQTIDVTTTQKTIKFAVPNNLVGSNTYSLRIKASTGAVSVAFKNSFGNSTYPVYYKEYEAPFYINDKNDTALICSGGNLTLSISSQTPSPVAFSNIKYKWYKDDVVVSGQTSKELVVTVPGKYYAEIDYGQCTDVNFSSNRVTVSSSSSGSAASIISSLGNPFCSDGAGTVLTATSGNSYVWKKNGTEITGAIGRTYSTNESGLYTVEVDFGGCKATGSIDLQSNTFNASIDAPDISKLLESETLNVSVTSDATNPTYEWSLNGNVISGATTDTYVVAVRGDYKVKISQASGCISSREFSFKVMGESGTATLISNIVKLSGDNPYWNIPDIYKNSTTKVIIISSNGDKVLDVVNYQGDWPQTLDFKNVNPVYYYVIQSETGEKKGSITVIK